MKNRFDRNKKKGFFLVNHKLKMGIPKVVDWLLGLSLTILLPALDEFPMPAAYDGKESRFLTFQGVRAHSKGRPF